MKIAKNRHFFENFSSKPIDPFLNFSFYPKSMNYTRCSPIGWIKSKIGCENIAEMKYFMVLFIAMAWWAFTKIKKNKKMLKSMCTCTERKTRINLKWKKLQIKEKWNSLTRKWSLWAHSKVKWEVGYLTFAIKFWIN